MALVAAHPHGKRFFCLLLVASFLYLSVLANSLYVFLSYHLKSLFPKKSNLKKWGFCPKNFRIVITVCPPPFLEAPISRSSPSHSDGFALLILFNPVGLPYLLGSLASLISILLALTDVICFPWVSSSSVKTWTLTLNISHLFISLCQLNSSPTHSPGKFTAKSGFVSYFWFFIPLPSVMWYVLNLTPELLQICFLCLLSFSGMELLLLSGLGWTVDLSFEQIVSPSSLELESIVHVVSGLPFSLILGRSHVSMDLNKV